VVTSSNSLAVTFRSLDGSLPAGTLVFELRQNLIRIVYVLLRVRLCLVKRLGTTVGCMKGTVTRRRESSHTSRCRVARHESPRLRVNVIATTDKATVRALQAATCLAANLGAQIALIAVEAVPSSCPLQKPPVSVSVLERRLCGLVYDAGIFEEEIRIRLCLSRDQRTALQRILEPHSLVVLGGREHWWSGQNRHLKEWLSGCGHQVIIAGDKPDPVLDCTDKRTDVSSTKGLAGRSSLSGELGDYEKTSLLRGLE